jgi:hypothetical protein
MHYAEHAQAQAHSIIEIADNEEHSAEFTIDVPEGSTLELRAANRFRPYLRVPDRLGQAVERCRFHGARGSRLILDGLLFGDGEVLIEGEFDVVEIRHCTLSPGRTRLVLQANDTRVQIKRSIVGSIVTRVPKRDRTQSDARKHAPAYNEPIHLSIENSIIDGSYDGSRCDHPVLSGANRWAHVRLSADRSTIFGAADVHAVGLIQNSLFVDCLCVENTQAGCLRFSYVAPGSCTPPQFRCQPAQAVERLSSAAQDLSATFESERQRVKPQFLNRRYPHPDYARLVDDCAAEIARGAEDEGEMGAYHDEYFAQRATHLRRRIEEFVPAGFDATVLFET